MRLETKADMGRLVPCGDPENFARGGPTLTKFFFCFCFFFDEGREDPNSTKRGPASETTF